MVKKFGRDYMKLLADKKKIFPKTKEEIEVAKK